MHQKNTPAGYGEDASQAKQSGLSMLQAGSAQLSFALNNEDAVNTIYITGDPTVNKLSFVITTNTDDTTFTPGTLVPPSSAPGGTGSLLYLNLSSLQLTGEEFEALEPSAEGWVFEKYAPATLAMTPTETIVINNSISSAVVIKVNKLTIATPPSVPNADLHVTGFRVPPVTLDNRIPGVFFFKVLLQNAPDGQKNLYESIDVALTSGAYIVNSIPDFEPVSNSLSFVLKPGSTPATVLAGPESKFFVSFVYASGKPGYGALTTPAQATNIVVKQGQNAADWSVTPDPGQQNPSWILVPPDGAPIVGTGVKSVVEFNINSIITTFEPGPTLLYVQYENIPGYNDGSYYILLGKVPHVSLSNFRATPNPAYLNENGKAKIRLTWDADNVGTATLYPLLANVKGVFHYDVEIENTTTFTLSATGEELSNKGNVASRTLAVTVLPKINSFAASPQNVYYKNFPNDVALSWNVSTGGKIRLISSVTGESPYLFNPVGTVVQSIKEPQMLTLVPDGEKDPLYHRNIVLSAFKVSRKTSMCSSAGKSIVILPAGNVILTAMAGVEKLFALNTFNLRTAAASVKIGKSCHSLAVSPDGQWLYAVDSDTASISVIRLDNTPGKFSMTLFSKIEDVGTRPWNIALSPLGDQLYVINKPLSGNGSLIVINKNDQNEYTVAATIELEKDPEAIAVSPSGEYLFATNTGSNSMTVITRVGSDTFEFTKSVPTGKFPSDLKVTPDGKWVFVCNSGDNNVMIISATSFNPTTTLLPTGGSPAFLSISPSSDYIFVTNKNKSITLIGLDNTVNRYKVLEAAITCEQITEESVISPNGHQVFIAGGVYITVLSLDTYQPLPEPVKPKISSPTCTAVSADNKKVAVWARPSGNIKRDQGANLIDIKTKGITQVMLGLDIYDVAYSSDKKLVYVIQEKENVLSLYARTAKDFITFQEIDGFTGTPSRLAVSPNGKQLFVSLTKVNGDDDTAIMIVNTPDFSISQIITLPSVEDKSPIPLAVTPDGSKIFAVQNNTVSILVKKDDKFHLEAKSVKVGEQSGVIGILTDGSKAITVASESHSIAVINTADYEVETFIIPDSFSNYVSGLAISPDGKNIVVSDTQGANVLMLDTMTYSVFSKLPTDKFPQFPVYLLDGSAIYVPCMLSNSVSVIQQIQPVDPREEISEANRAGAVADDYQGMYMRKYLGQTGPIATGSAVTLSPDIIPYGITPTEDPKEFILPENWNIDLAKEVLTGQYNNLYARGNSNANTAKEMNLEMNFAPSNVVMWPNNWADNRIPLATNPGVFSQKVKADPMSKFVSMEPFQWNVPKLPPGADHFCLVARMDEPVPTVNFSWDTLITWIKKPNVAWRNVYPVDKNKPDWQRQFQLNIPNDAKIPDNSKIYVFLDFENMPAKVDVQFTCPDQEADPLIIKERVQLKEPNEVIGLWTRLPRGFSSYVTVFFWSNGITIPVGASVNLNSYYMPGAMTDEEFDTLCEKFNQPGITHQFIKDNIMAEWYLVGACHNVVME